MAERVDNVLVLAKRRHVRRQADEEDTVRHGRTIRGRRVKDLVQPGNAAVAEAACMTAHRPGTRQD